MKKLNSNDSARMSLARLRGKYEIDACIPHDKVIWLIDNYRGKSDFSRIPNEIVIRYNTIINDPAKAEREYIAALNEQERRRQEKNKIRRMVMEPTIALSRFFK